MIFAFSPKDCIEYSGTKVDQELYLNEKINEAYRSYISRPHAFIFLFSEKTEIFTSFSMEAYCCHAIEIKIEQYNVFT